MKKALPGLLLLIVGFSGVYGQCPAPIPPTPAFISQLGRTSIYTMVDLNGTGTNKANVSPGATVTISLGRYTTIDDGAGGCLSCITQHYIGIAGGSFTGNLFSSQYGGSETHSFTFTAPATAGIYYINHAASWELNYIQPDFNAGFEANSVAVLIVGGVSTVPPPAISFSTPVTFCNGEFVELITRPAASYQWKKDGLNITGAVSSTYRAIQAGKYAVSVNGGACTSEAVSVVTNACSPTVTTLNNTAIGNQNWKDPVFWRSKGLTTDKDVDGVPDENDEIVIGGPSSGKLYANDHIQVKSLRIENTSDLKLDLNNKTLNINGGSLRVPRPGALLAENATVKLKGDTKINVADKIGKLEVDAGDDNVLELENDLNVVSKVTLTSLKELKGGKDLKNEGDLVLNHKALTGDGRVVLNGSVPQRISGNGPLHDFYIDKSGGEVILDDDLRINNSTAGAGAKLGGNATPIKEGVKNSKVILEDPTEVKLDYYGTLDRLEVNTPSLWLNVPLHVFRLLDITSRAAKITAREIRKLLAIEVIGDLHNASNEIRGDAEIAFVSSYISAYVSIAGGVLPHVGIYKTGGSLVLNDDLRIGSSEPGQKASFTSNQIPVKEGFPGKKIILDGENEVVVNAKGSIDNLEKNAKKITLLEDLTVLKKLEINQANELNGPGKKVLANGDIAFNAPQMAGSAKVAVVGAGEQKISGTGVVHNLLLDKPSGFVTMVNDLTIAHNVPGQKASISSTNAVPVKSNAAGTTQLILKDAYEVQADVPGKIDAVTIKTPQLSLIKDLNVAGNVAIQAPLKLNGTFKQVAVQGNLSSNSPVTGDVKIALIAPTNVTLTGSPAASFNTIEINKPVDYKVSTTSNIKVQNINVISGTLEGAKNTFIGGNVRLQPIPITPEKKPALQGNAKILGALKSSGGKISPGFSPGLIEITEDLVVDNTSMTFELEGTEPGSGYDQISVEGQVQLGAGVELIIIATNIFPKDYVLISNGSTSPVSGRFTGLPNNGSILTAGGFTFQIFYNGGDGNDVILRFDNIAPVLSGVPGNVTIACNGIPPVAQNITATDNVDPAPVITFTETSTQGSGPAISTYVITRTWTARDATGNTATATQQITVKDSKKPVLVCPATATFCYATNDTYTLPALQATDDCNISSVNYVITGATSRSGSGSNASGIFKAGTSTITWTVKDAAGNTSTCQSTVVINPRLNISIPDGWALGSGCVFNTVYKGYLPASFILLIAKPSGGKSPFTYKWSNGATASFIIVNPGSATSYTVTVKDARGCIQAATKKINVVDVRCGSKMNKVSLCYKSKPLCLDAEDVLGYLLKGANLGDCNVTSQKRGIGPEAAEDVTLKSEFTMSAYPNPSYNYFTIAVKSNNLKDKVRVTIMDIVGKVLETRIVNAGETIQLGAAYRAGIYYAEAVQANKKVTIKLMK